MLMDPEYYRRFTMQANASDYDLLLSVNRMRDPCNGAAVYVDATCASKRIVEKARAGHLDHQLEQRGSVRLDHDAAGLRCGA